MSDLFWTKIIAIDFVVVSIKSIYIIQFYTVHDILLVCMRCFSAISPYSPLTPSWMFLTLTSWVCNPLCTAVIFHTGKHTVILYYLPLRILQGSYEKTFAYGKHPERSEGGKSQTIKKHWTLSNIKCWPGRKRRWWPNSYVLVCACVNIGSMRGHGTVEESAKRNREMSPSSIAQVG